MNLSNIQRTALPQDTKAAVTVKSPNANIDFEKIDNFALLFNKFAHFADENNLDSRENIDQLLKKKIKAHFFYKEKQKAKTIELNLINKWDTGAFSNVYGEFLDDIYSAFSALYSEEQTTQFELQSNWRIALGMGNESVYENGFTFHPTYGVPYLPGSSIKGIVRNWAKLNGKDSGDDSKLYLQIFGNEQDEPEIFQQGKIIFFDAYPQRQISETHLQADIMNNHYPEYYEGKKAPADWLNPRPILFLTMKGLKFTFHFASVTADNSKELLAKTKAWLSYALDELGIGAKTSAGYGRFALDEKPKIVLAQFKEGNPQQKLKNNLAFDAVVTEKGKPCKVEVYGFNGNKYPNISVSGNTATLEIGDVIEVIIQTDNNRIKITQASLSKIKSKRQ